MKPRDSQLETRNSNFFLFKILPVSRCSPWIKFQFSANPMIPIDHRGGGGVGVAFILGKAGNGKLPARAAEDKKRIDVAKESASGGHIRRLADSILRAKSLFLKILSLSDLFPRFCELKRGSKCNNPNRSKILQKSDGRIFSLQNTSALRPNRVQRRKRQTTGF